jgi:hypothetical protein
MGFCIITQIFDKFHQTVLTIIILSTLMINHITIIFEELPEFRDYLSGFLWATYATFMIGTGRFFKNATNKYLWRLLERNLNRGNPTPMNLLLSEKIILVCRLYNLCFIFQMMQLINNSGIMSYIESTELPSPTQLYLNKARQ